ncbi:lysylphosphatidylglycerol synthase transmembrane domain-containing protein [Methanosarcina sp. T3]|uniref:lysylphosphatidylglycerol synthase transmembrane domain-containing protein n=1 Tax=Methanosarcina sp. T3 TaxID=3439062 RepID=UPI003F85301F
MEINGQEGLQMPENKDKNYKILVSSPPFVLKAGRYLPTLIFLGLAVHLILPQLASVESSLQVIRTMALWAVLLAAVAEIISYIGYGYLINSVLAIVDQQLSVLKGAGITLAAASMGMLAGGTLGNAAATYSWVRKSGVSAEGSGLAGTLPTIFNNAILTLLAAAGIVHLLLVHELSTIQFYAFLLILGILSLGVAAVSWGKSHRSRFTAVALRISASFAGLRHKPYIPTSTENSVNRLFAALDILHEGGWQFPALLAAFSIGFDALTLYLFFIAAGHPVGLEVLLIGYGLPLLFGKMAFVIPGGVGVVESTMIALYTGLGVPGSLAVVVVLGYRVFSFWIPTLVGFPIAFYLQRT